jgi:hypothetical protein
MISLLLIFVDIEITIGSNECIPSFNWNSIISPENNMNENCQAFTNKFIEMIKKCVPQKEVTIRLNDKVCFNSELRREIRNKFICKCLTVFVHVIFWRYN